MGFFFYLWCSVVMPPRCSVLPTGLFTVASSRHQRHSTSRSVGGSTELSGQSGSSDFLSASACLYLYKKADIGPTEHTSAATESSTPTSRWREIKLYLHRIVRSAVRPWKRLFFFKTCWQSTEVRFIGLSLFFLSLSFFLAEVIAFHFGTLLTETTSAWIDACSLLTLSLVDYPETVFL